MTDFIVLYRPGEAVPLKHIATVTGKEPTEAAEAIEEALEGEGEYVAVSLDGAVTRRVRMNYSVEVLS